MEKRRTQCGKKADLQPNGNPNPDPVSVQETRFGTSVSLFGKVLIQPPDLNAKKGVWNMRKFLRDGGWEEAHLPVERSGPTAKRSPRKKRGLERE